VHLVGSKCKTIIVTVLPFAFSSKYSPKESGRVCTVGYLCSVIRKFKIFIEFFNEAAGCLLQIYAVD
jgi:hypothetical protein